MLRFISLGVIGSFLALWLAGETPRSIKTKLTAGTTVEHRYVDAVGQRSDWGTR